MTGKLLAALLATLALSAASPGEGEPAPPAPPPRGNHAPKARVSSPAAATVGTIIVLDGSGSFDPDGDRIRLFWVQRSGPRVMSPVATDGGERLSFRPTQPGEYAFELSVSDGLLDSEPVRATIRVREGVAPGVADAGADIQATEGELVMLRARPYGRSRSLTYHWRQTSGPRVTKFSMPEEPADGSTVEFTPLEPGEYVFELVVSDATDSSLPDTVKVTVKPRNRPPALKAPEVLSAEVGAEFVVAVEASDPDGDALRWRWRQVSGPRSILRGPESSRSSPRLKPVAPGKYLFEVEVSDGHTRPVKALVALIVEEEKKEEGAK